MQEERTLRNVKNLCCLFSSPPSLLASQLTVPVGQIASVLDVMAVGAAPVYAKAAREMIASVILLIASVPTKAKPAANEESFRTIVRTNTQDFESYLYGFMFSL